MIGPWWVELIRPRPNPAIPRVHIKWTATCPTCGTDATWSSAALIHGTSHSITCQPCGTTSWLTSSASNASDHPVAHVTHT